MLKDFAHNLGLWKLGLPYLAVPVDKGPKNKHTIVFLHGIGASSSAWEPLIKELGKSLDNYRYVAVDLLGFGASPKGKNVDYSAECHVAAIRKTLKKHKVKTPFTLVGHSMGSIISARYCRRYSSEVSQALLVSLPLYLPDKYSRGFLSKESNKGYRDLYEYVRANPHLSMRAVRGAKKVGIDFGMDASKKYEKALSLSLKNTIENQSTYTDILDTKVPITEVHGNLDGLLVEANMKQLDKIKNAKVVVANGAGHKINRLFARKIKKELLQILP